MRISYEALVILRSELPRGSATRIRKRLIAKGHPYCTGYINRCLNPDYNDKSEIIIDEAVSFCEELIRGAENREERIMKLRKAFQ